METPVFTPSAMLLFSLVLLNSCGGSRTSSGPSAFPPAPAGETSAQEEEDGMELIGTLARTVEAGGWILNTEKKGYLLLSIEGYRQQDWFREGVRVKVVGEESPGTITIFMQGTPFRVKSMEPLN